MVGRVPQTIGRYRSRGGLPAACAIAAARAAPSPKGGSGIHPTILRRSGSWISSSTQLAVVILHCLRTVMPPQGSLAVVTAEVLAEADGNDGIYGSSLPPLTFVTVNLPVLMSADLMVCDVGLPLSVCQVLVMIFLPSE